MMEAPVPRLKRHHSSFAARVSTHTPHMNGVRRFNAGDVRAKAAKLREAVGEEAFAALAKEDEELAKKSGAKA